MRVVFMGSPAFAASILREVAQQHEVAAVYTQPDAVRSRGKRLEPTPVRRAAEELGIPVFTPRSLKDGAVQDGLAALAPDVVCVAAYGAILPEEVLAIPPFGCVNVHASLLPRWRGAAPIERAVLAGDATAGVCIMRMERGLDTGDWCVRREIPIDGLSAAQVAEELASLGGAALLVALQQMEQGSAVWTAQDPSSATYADKIAKGELDMAPGETARSNVRRVLASSAAHPSRVRLAGRDATVEEARAGDAAVAAGHMSVEGGRLLLGCADGSVEVLRLKPAGKKSMEAGAFLQGFRAEGALSWDRP